MLWHSIIANKGRNGSATTIATKIHGILHWKDGMAYNKTHVELMPIRCTD